jgi:hypothetical protein
MFRYDANEGGFAKLGDYVEVVRSGIESDGLKGRIGGWGDLDLYIALVALDKPLADGRTIVAWPVVCLNPVVTITNLVNIQKKTSLHTFEEAYRSVAHGNLCGESPAVDTDGYTIWNGGAKRPVSDDTIVRVKIRSGIRRDPVTAKQWPQICWLHREVGDPMNQWDIVAYKVAK